MIHLSPIGGLSNRMRAIDSAIGLANSLEIPLHIFWERSADLNCPFRLLFEPLTIPDVTLHERRIRPLRFVPTHPRLYKLCLALGLNKQSFSVYENDRLQHLDISRINRGKPIIISSFARFYRNKDKYSCFKPSLEILQRIEERTQSFNQHTIGVHIRRTDHVKSIQQSPDDLFMTRMEEAIEAEPTSTFYLATDSMEVKTSFKKRFGPRIITTPYQASRDSIEGIREAAVELYSLARTCKIFGSYGSSYSRLAAELGGIPLQHVINT